MGFIALRNLFSGGVCLHFSPSFLCLLTFLTFLSPPAEGLLYSQRGSVLDRRGCLPFSRLVDPRWSLTRSLSVTLGSSCPSGSSRHFQKGSACRRLAGLLPAPRCSWQDWRWSNSPGSLSSGGGGDREETRSETGGERQTRHTEGTQGNEGECGIWGFSSAGVALTEAKTRKKKGSPVSSPHLATILSPHRDGEARRRWWKKCAPLWPPWKTRYTNRSLEEKLLCVPVYVVVNRYGAPFLSPPSPAVLAEQQMQEREGREFRLPQQIALAFLDGEDATAYLHELVQSNPGGTQVEARLYCLPLSTVWEQQRRVLLDPRRETSHNGDEQTDNAFSVRRFFLGDSGGEEEEKAREREEEGREAAQPQLLWQIVPSTKQVRNARRQSGFRGFREGTDVPVFYVDDLLVERDGDSVLPLFFSLEDLQTAWNKQREKEEEMTKKREKARKARGEQGDEERDEEEDRERETRRQRLRQKPPVKVMNLLKLLLVQAEQPKGDLVADGRWGFVPSSESLAFLEKEKRRGVAPARLLFGPDDQGQA
ncbi:hypothetical protein TGGT1_286050 [Toxoplasma gondii GT1]|uniref:Apicoplast Tic22 n=4 Tax=Toxoplasma gondii TaxID=5811 RepID=K4HQR5_TOXGO|nr:apicoplast Tic22 [Toxoplasma gondii]EPR59415.1 hypothetical protein TGGT1_286050 [Toxoplasma gondii GT1]KAF4643843.1 hypothetical protein TGRH88_025990 [Toxoplasma gondii]KFG54760.1 Tic22-like family protein [Toxoplasma gondii FOU]PUA88048.1 Tic22-like family protein [Toxoplasma gondii TgCATBr9]